MTKEPKTHQHLPHIPQLIRELGSEMGATVWIEPEYGYVGEITFANRRRHLFRNTNLNVNRLGSIEIVKDKGYCSMFLRRYGYQVADGKTFFSEAINRNVANKRTIDDGWEYIQTLGLPVMVKPNDLSQGSGVQKVESKEEYYRAAEAIFEKTRVMIVERFYIGHDYRVVVFDGEIISAYERVPLSVTGDGVSSIDELISQKQEGFFRDGRDTIIDRDDPRIFSKLRKQGLDFASIVSGGQRVFLLDNANLSTGGESIDVTERLHPDFAELAKNATRDIGLTLCGVDIMTRDITESLTHNHDYIIIELNGAPGLDNYMSTGEVQRNNVRNMYRKILKHLSEMK